MSRLFASGSVQDLSSDINAPATGGAAETEAPEGSPDEGTVNYDEPALVEVELDEVEYRLDSGRAGTALCISTRPSGTYSWTFRGEARWQANVLRCARSAGAPRTPSFDRTVLGRLSQALKELASGSD
jgi:hypothetical protein